MHRFILPLLSILVLITVFKQILQHTSFDSNIIHKNLFTTHIQKGVRIVIHDKNVKLDENEIVHSLRKDFYNFENDILTKRNHHFERFLRCPITPNPKTSHIRLSYDYFNISMIPSGSENNKNQRLFNPTIIPLPYWTTSSSKSKYLLVSRLVTPGLHQESLACFAEICIPKKNSSLERKSLPSDIKSCSKLDLQQLGSKGGLRCISSPIRINIPSTPALYCTGPWSAFPDIPGFHDPRIFWSNKGEPLIIINSASQYGCVGLWIVDLRTLIPELDDILKMPEVGREGFNVQQTFPIPISYPYLTELTRNPRNDRREVEKNWMTWFPNQDEAYVQYDMVGQDMNNLDQVEKYQNRTKYLLQDKRDEEKRGGRTFAKLIGNGYTTTNLTHPNEETCFHHQDSFDNLGKRGHWHQGSNSLRLILCTRSEVRSGNCDDDEELIRDGRSVHFAIMHRKFSNEMDLPMRYERYVIVWESRRPFKMLGISKWPILMHSERAYPWTVEENWYEEEKGNDTISSTKNTTGKGGRRPQSSAYFSYTPSLAWAWRSRNTDLGHAGHKDIKHLSTLGTGYLDDTVLIGIGLDDVEQVFVRVPAQELLQCMRLCQSLKPPQTTN